MKATIPIFGSVAVALLGALLLTAPAVTAAGDWDVHGLSSREGSTLTVGVLPGTGIAYPNVVWYVYYTGTVEYYLAGELKETIESDGLTVWPQTYEAGQRYDVSFRFGAAIVNFTMNVRDVISTVDPEATPPDMISMLQSEYTMQLLKVGGSSGIAAAAAFYIMYRIVRERNKRTVRDL